METGQALKELRLMKGKTVKQACGNSINRGNYWRIENGEVIPRIDTLNTILLNLNVSFSDYVELYNDEHNEYEEIMSEIKKSFSMKNIDKLTQIENYCKNQYDLTNNEYFLHSRCLSSILINRINGEQHNKENANILKEYLFSCPNWTYYEMRLLINSLFLYDDSSMITFFYKTMRYVDKLEKQKNFDPLKIKICENLTTHFIYKRNYEKANEIYVVMSNLELKESSANERIVKMWVTGIVEILIKGNHSGLNRVKKALSIYKALGMKGQHNLYKSWTDTLLK